MAEWNGYEILEMEFEGYPAKIILPKESNGNLMLKTEYWDAFPEAVELPLLERGFYLCYIQNENRFGTNSDLDRKARFVRFVQDRYGLHEKCVPVGMSCGGLFAIKFAARYPEMVSCLYLDAPVVNYMSWPCGFGIAQDVPEEQSEILNALGLKSISELLAYRDMPLDHLETLVNHKIPVVMVTGDSDRTVPYCENGILLEKMYKDAGMEMKVYVKPGGDHHPHGLKDSARVVEFIVDKTLGGSNVRN